MKMNYKFLLLALILFLQTRLVAQQADTGSNSGTLFQSRLSGELYTPPVIHAGNPWFIGEWTSSRITLHTGETIHGEMLRYNGYLDELFWLTHETYHQVQLDKKLIKKFELLDPESRQWLRFEKFEVKNILTPGTVSLFVQQLHHDNISLHVHRKVRETGAVTSVMVGGSLVSRRVIGPDYQYYLQRNDQVPEAIQPTRRSLLRAFPEHRQQIRQSLRRNNLRIRSEAQLIAAVEIINEIVQPGTKSQKK